MACVKKISLKSAVSPHVGLGSNELIRAYHLHITLEIMFLSQSSPFHSYVTEACYIKILVRLFVHNLPENVI